MEGLLITAGAAVVAVAAMVLYARWAATWMRAPREGIFGTRLTGDGHGWLYDHWPFRRPSTRGRRPRG